jgi:hypothetical protein
MAHYLTFSNCIISILEKSLVQTCFLLFCKDIHITVIPIAPFYISSIFGLFNYGMLEHFFSNFDKTFRKSLIFIYAFNYAINLPHNEIVSLLMPCCRVCYYSSNLQAAKYTDGLIWLLLEYHITNKHMLSRFKIHFWSL